VSGIVVQLVLAGHRCLVVGAGRVGARKVDALLAAGATVVVVAPELDEHLEGLAASGTAELVLHRRRFVASDVDGCALVVAATDDPRVNELAAAAAAAAGALVNRADRSGPDAAVPAADGASRSADERHPAPGRDALEVRFCAAFRSGSATVAVATDGRAPSVARWLRDRLAEFEAGRAAALVELGARRLGVPVAGPAELEACWGGER